MPELPEVETTRRGIEPHLAGKTIESVVVRNRNLRWPIPSSLPDEVTGATLHSVGRRAKYLLLNYDGGTLVIHLGMSGSLRIIDHLLPPQAHDHVDIRFTNGSALRLNDPRRFGSLHLIPGRWQEHPLFAHLGPEPLTDEFHGAMLYHHSRGRRIAVKPFIMDPRTVVGVGNIYASEALFRAEIDPRRAAGKISLRRYQNLAEAISEVLTEAIAQGGTTLRDFTGSDGKPGYFAQHLQVYGRAGEPCYHCDRKIRLIRQGQRASYYCSQCQR